MTVVTQHKIMGEPRLSHGAGGGTVEKCQESWSLGI